MRIALVVVLALVLAAPAQALVRQFRTPSTNIGCIFSSEPGGGGPYLRCDIRSGLKPKPAGRCTGDWTGYEMNMKGRARVVCAGDTAVNRRAKVLRYGSRWSQAVSHAPRAARACAAGTAAATASF